MVLVHSTTKLLDYRWICFSTVASIKKSSCRKFCESGDRKGKDVKAKQSVRILPSCCQPADILNSESGHWLKISQYLKRKRQILHSKKRQWMSEKCCGFWVCFPIFLLLLLLLLSFHFLSHSVLYIYPKTVGLIVKMSLSSHTYGC